MNKNDEVSFKTKRMLKNPTTNTQRLNKNTNIKQTKTPTKKPSILTVTITNKKKQCFYFKNSFKRYQVCGHL